MMIAIAGGSGFVGFNIARCLADQGQNVLLIQRHHVKEPPPLLTPYWGNQVKEALGDMLDLSFIMSITKTYSIDSFIHVGASTSGALRGLAEEAVHQKVQVQLQGVMNLLEATRTLELRRVIFISSVEVYRGRPHDVKVWNEDALLPSTSPSYISNIKKAAESISSLYAQSYNLSVACLRVGAIYGIGVNNPVMTMVNGALSGEPVNLKLACNRRMHGVYAKDIGLAVNHILKAESIKHFIYNLSDGSHPTMQEIADTVKDFIPGAEINLGPDGTEKTEYLPVDMSRLKDEFGFIPHDINQGIAACINFLKEGQY